MTEARPRIGLVIASLRQGGAERMILALARSLIGAGYDIRLLCLDTDFEMPLPGDARERDLIERSIAVLGGNGNVAGTLRKCLAFPGLWWRLEREIRVSRLELVISFMERANLLNLLGTNRFPRMISIRKHPEAGLAEKTPLKRWLVRHGYRVLHGRASEINFNSSEAAESFQHLFPANRRRISVVPNFFDEDIEEKAQAPLEPAGNRTQARPFILACGRLMPEKGHKALIRAYRDLAPRHAQVDLVILGGGPMSGELNDLVVELGLVDRVHLPGFDANPYRWMQRCLLFVLPSIAEGFPNALLEAMALGKAVVACDCYSGPRELLAPGTCLSHKTRTVELAPYGVLTPPLTPGDAAAGSVLTPGEAGLASGLEQLLNDSTLRDRYAHLARQRAQAFSKQAVLGEWLERVRQYIPATDDR